MAKERYVIVEWPESQLFMEGHMDGIYLINDEEGARKHGKAAYFVEEGLYLNAGAELGAQPERPTTLIDIFLRETRSDPSDRKGPSENLKEYYEGANQMQRAAINEVFTLVCGLSYEDLAEMGAEGEHMDEMSPTP